MIMRAGQPLLLPAHTGFIWASLVSALGANIFLSTVAGRAPWTPDILAVCIVFWTVHQPLRVGIASAFALGLLMDVHAGALLGQHALSYTALSFCAIAISRRLLWYSLASQALQVLPLLTGAALLQLFVRTLAQHEFPGWQFFLSPIIEVLLWPLITKLLLAPQMRAPDPDADRPL